MELIKIYYRSYCVCAFVIFVIFFNSFTFSGLFCIWTYLCMKWWVLADVSWQRTKVVMLSGNNEKWWIRHRKIIVTQEFTVRYESVKHLSDVARKLSLYFFSLIPLSLFTPPFYTVTYFFRYHCVLFTSTRDWRTRKIKSLLSRDYLLQMQI